MSSAQLVAPKPSKQEVQKTWGASKVKSTVTRKIVPEAMTKAEEVLLEKSDLSPMTLVFGDPEIERIFAQTYIPGHVVVPLRASTMALSLATVASVLTMPDAGGMTLICKFAEVAVALIVAGASNFITGKPILYAGSAAIILVLDALGSLSGDPANWHGHLNTFIMWNVTIVLVWGIPFIYAMPAISLSCIVGIVLSILADTSVEETAVDCTADQIECTMTFDNCIDNFEDLVSEDEKSALVLQSIVTFGVLLVFTVVCSYICDRLMRKTAWVQMRLATEYVHTAKQMEMTEWFKAGGTQQNLMYGKRMSLSNISNQSCHIEHTDVEMIEAVGEGAFGLVMKGRYKETVVAVKKLSINLEQCNQNVLMEFGAEASVMAELRHPNIVMFMGVTVHPEFIALVMEFMPKGNAYNLLHVDKGELDFSLLLRILCDSARGMNYLHQYSPPIIHKDLKSLNILLSTDWRGKIADFGLSTLQQAVAEAVAETKGEVKKEDEVSFNGSIVWAAPEVLEGEEANQKSDVYAFGIVLWEVLTREMPYRFLAQEAIPFNVTSNKRPCHYSDGYLEMKADFDELPHKASMNKLMEECWAQDPGDRPSFAHCIRQIEEAAQAYLCGEDKDKDWEELCLFPDRKVQATNGVDNLEFTISEADLIVGATIGKGSFGAVFKGSYIGTTVAIKKLFMKGVPVEILSDFHKECNIMQQLRHPNVVLFMGSCCKPPNLLLITEFLDQGSFFDVYHKLPKHPKLNTHLLRSLDLAIDMCKGIGYLHHHNPPIVHRDLKSQNVMVDDKWTSKIGDFGLSRFKDAGKTMSMCGSPLWIAPEVLRGENYGVGCDIFSFSIILWEALAWSEPYPSMSSNRVMRGVSAGTLRPDKPDDCPDKLFSILKHCWAEDPNQRPTMEQTLEMLEHQKKKLKAVADAGGEETSH